ncbi:hypothetical protein B4100_1102 [Heyndrickxia coagulans]|jgi:hypothetical protein|nr:hypothetical protein B4100_1102 [Heyndrickxia coagulans]
MESGSEKPAIFQKPMKNGKTAERSSGTPAKRKKKLAHHESRLSNRDVFSIIFPHRKAFGV